MPITFKKNITKKVSVAVWQIAETEEFFLNSLKLSQEDETHIKKCQLQKVRLQKLACRAALAELLGTNKIDITYSETGQPQLKDDYISFSHTKTSVAVALSKISSIGIDIEKLTPRILPLYPRFMSQKEIENCDVNNLKDLYYYWCAKEAMYKWFATKNLDFIEDLQVHKNEKKGVIGKKHTVQFVDFCVDNQRVVVCFD
jgi:phosphopantetheinyl transferase